MFKNTKVTLLIKPRFQALFIMTKCTRAVNQTELVRNNKYGSIKAGARTLIGGRGGELHIHMLMFCSTSFFSNQMQIDQFEKKSIGQNMNI